MNAPQTPVFGAGLLGASGVLVEWLWRCWQCLMPSSMVEVCSSSAACWAMGSAAW
ncbi:MAG: hypothetical protein IPL33_07960 [Sphingobacteriales bacterium]|nr:hypothetical protein [Sphingobacteriales bacterium]